MPVCREQLRQQLSMFELEMRVIAGSYVTTERFLKDFLARAEKICRSAPMDERAWVSEQICQILEKFRLEGGTGDKPSN